jgi:preprotein translocase subunit SecE
MAGKDLTTKDKGGKAPPAVKKKGLGDIAARAKKTFTDIRLELKRVTWPTWRELFNYTVTVLFVCAIMGVLIYVLDLILSQLLKMTIGIGT